VERASAKHVEMDVEHSLPGFTVCVEYRPVTAIRVAVIFRDRGRPPRHLAHERIVGRRQLVQRGDMAARDYKRVQRRLRVDVCDNEEIVIFVEDLRRDLFCGDFAEEAVAAHIVSSP